MPAAVSEGFGQSYCGFSLSSRMWSHGTRRTRIDTVALAMLRAFVCRYTLWIQWTERIEYACEYSWLASPRAGHGGTRSCSHSHHGEGGGRGRSGRAATHPSPCSRASAAATMARKCTSSQFATSARLSAWHRRGAHQHPSTQPRSQLEPGGGCRAGVVCASASVRVHVSCPLASRVRSSASRSVCPPSVRLLIQSQAKKKTGFG